MEIPFLLRKKKHRIFGVFSTSDLPKLIANSKAAKVKEMMKRSVTSKMHIYIYTLQGINISHLGKRKIIFKMPFWGDMLVPWRVYITGRSLGGYYVYIYICISLKTNMTTESHYFLIGDTSSFMVGFPASHVSFPGCIYGHILLGANIPTDSVCLKMIIFLFSFGGLWTSMDSFPGGYIQRMGIKGFISWQLVFSKIWECLLDPSFPPKHDSLSHD